VCLRDSRLKGTIRDRALLLVLVSSRVSEGLQVLCTIPDRALACVLVRLTVSKGPLGYTWCLREPLAMRCLRDPLAILGV
jgi:hypothetical protein